LVIRFQAKDHPMNGRSLFLSLAYALGLGGMCGAAEVTPSDAVIDNILKLGNSRYAVRDLAARELIRIGEPALKPLQSVLNSNDEEVRRRAETIITAINTRLENEKLLRAPKLRLTFKDKPLDEALVELNQKTGLNYTLDAKSGKSPKMPVTLDTGDVFYWEAIEQFLASTGLVEAADNVIDPAFDSNQQLQKRYIGRARIAPQPTSPNNRTRLVESKSPIPVSANTLVRVKAIPVLVPPPGAVKGSNEIQLFLNVTPAPSLAWQDLINIEVRKAVDDRGIMLAQSHLRAMPQFNDGEGVIWNGNGGLQIQGQIIVNGGGKLIINGNTIQASGEPVAQSGSPFQVPVTLLGKDHPSKLLKELNGVVAVRLLSPVSPLVSLDNLLTMPTKDVVKNGEYQIQIVDRKAPRNGFMQIRVKITAPAQEEMMNAFGGGGQIVMRFDGNGAPGNPASAIVIQDASGKVVPNVPVNLQEQTFDGVNQISEYLVNVPTKGQTEPAPMKLVLNGRRSVCVDVPFALKNVPLP